MLQPTLHTPIPLQTRVLVPTHYVGKKVRGTVAGIASLHVIFTYIVILDEPIDHEQGVTTAITITGTDLMNLDGVYEWRLTNAELNAKSR